jgi:hypothetical protein
VTALPIFCRQLSTSSFLEPARAGRAQPSSPRRAPAVGKLRRRPREDVEDNQFFFAEILAHMALRSSSRLSRELDQFLEQLLDAAAAMRCSSRSDRLKLLGEIGAQCGSVATIFSSCAAHGRLQRLELGVLVLRLLEPRWPAPRS